MARVKLGAVLSNISGKSGGGIFARNHYGLYSKNFTAPTNPNTPAQIAARAFLTQATQRWYQITASQQTVWKNFAANFPYKNIFGDSFIYTGQNLFIKCNINRLLCGQSLLDEPVFARVNNAFTSFDDIQCSIVGGYLRLYCTPSTVPADIVYIVYATTGLSPGISNAKKYFKVITTLAPSSSEPWDVAVSYLAVFPLPAVGQKVFIKLRPINFNSGLSGMSLINHCIVS